MSAILADQIALLLPFEAEFTPISSPFKDYHVYVYVKRLVVIFYLKMHFLRTF